MKKSEKKSRRGFIKLAAAGTLAASAPARLYIKQCDRCLPQVIWNGALLLACSSPGLELSLQFEQIGRKRRVH